MDQLLSHFEVEDPIVQHEEEAITQNLQTLFTENTSSLFINGQANKNCYKKCSTRDPLQLLSVDMNIITTDTKTTAELSKLTIQPEKVKIQIRYEVADRTC